MLSSTIMVSAPNGFGDGTAISLPVLHLSRAGSMSSGVGVNGGTCNAAGDVSAHALHHHSRRKRYFPEVQRQNGRFTARSMARIHASGSPWCVTTTSPGLVRAIAPTARTSLRLRRLGTVRTAAFQNGARRFVHLVHSCAEPRPVEKE